jgi:hypothetical protein
LRQEKEISKLREEGRLLYEQLYEKTARLKELEGILSKGGKVRIADSERPER